MKKLTIILLIISISTMIISCTNQEKSKDSSLKSDYMMGTVIQLKAYGDNADQIIDESFDLISELEGKMSLNIKGSEVNQINQSSGKRPISVSEDTYQVIAGALDYAKVSGGAFDPTIGPVVQVWGIGTEKSQVPDKEELKEELKLVDYQKVELSAEDKKIFLEQENMILDVGGIAKGYAADQVMKFLKGKGVSSAYISLGGNVSVLGKKPDGSLWKVGIQNPKAKSRGDVMGIVKLADQTVVTSGNYERYFMEDGVRYHHLLDPKTGYPARNGIISSTIITDSSFTADALSTAVYILGVEEGLELIKQFDDVEAILITEDNHVYLTEGLTDNLKIVDDKYKIVN